MRVSAQEFTHIGHMDENQDRSAILTAPYGERTLLVVADGLGGHSGASLAAQTVIDTAKRLWRQKAQPSKPEDFLQRLALESHAAINDAARSTGLEPRTTLAAFLAMGSSVLSVHAGDSRVMQINHDGLVKQTLDHSIARIKVLSGAISEEELATHSDQKRLYSHLGGEEDPHFEITRWDLSAGQRFVVCSDGFWEIFPVAEIQSLFDAHDPGRTLATGFREKLASLKSHDNTTAILAQVQPGPRVVWYWAAVAALAALAALTLGQPGNVAAEPPALPVPLGHPEAAGTASARRATRTVVPRMGPTGPSGLLAVPALAAQVTTSEGAESGSEGSRPSTAIPNERIQVRPADLVIPDGELAASVVEEELRQAGRLGPDDALKPQGESSSLGRMSSHRLQQMHQGIPVFAAEVVATTSGTRVISVQGHTASNIDIDTNPANDYAETVALAGASVQDKLEPDGDGSLVILASGNDHHLCWLGIVAVNGVQQRLILDAKTGRILLRLPVSLD